MHLHYSFTWSLHLGKSVHRALYNYLQYIIFIAYALQLCHLINYIFLQDKVSMELYILMNALNFIYIYIYIYIHTHTYMHRHTHTHVFVVWSLSCVWLFCNPMDYSPSGSSVHGISQARILEWVAISFSKGSSQPRDQTCVYIYTHEGESWLQNGN